jgi:uncharacterized membrane protein YdjX (TVP38/TMEM64 family)
MSNIRMKKIFAWIGITLFVAVFIYAALEFQESKHLNAHTIQLLISSFGPYATVGYVLVMIIAVISPMPDSMVSIAGGYLFGPILGSILSLVGLAIGTSFDFLVVRRFGRTYVKTNYPKSIHAIDKYAARLGWQTVVVMRMLPSVTFDVLGYAAGLSSMPYALYIQSSLLGAFPMTLYTVLLGVSLEVGSTRYIIGMLIIGVIGLVAGTIIIQRTNISSFFKKKKR